MGASDFSPRPYSYAMTESDFALDNFALAEEDYKYKVYIFNYQLRKMNIY